MRILNRLHIRSGVVMMIVALAIIISSSPQVSAQVAANKYFDLLEEGLASSRSQLPEITSAAEQAAVGFIAGGQIYSYSHARDFTDEAAGRAGGLMCLKQLKDQKIAKNDVILFGIRGALTKKDRALIKKWREAGAFVVTFGAWLGKSDPPAAQADFTSIKASGLKVIRDGKDAICPVDTVMNVVNLWTFTGELVAACTRRGKMPTLYQSYGAPGGRKRGEKYNGKVFHDDMTIKPIKPGTLGGAYLDVIRKSIKKIRTNEITKIARSGSQMRTSAKTKKPLILSVGHMFPDHFNDPRTPQGIVTRRCSVKKSPELTDNALRYVLYVGYQKAPKILIESARQKKIPLTYISVQNVKTSGVESPLIYIKPYWPITDNCVSISGYDIPILPASGVLDASIYWAIRAEECR